MRKLKLQMQVSIHGMVGVQRGHHLNWNKEARQYSIVNAVNVDGILLGRKTATDFIPHWKSVVNNPTDPVVTMVSLGQFPGLRPTPR
jgi:dihydrofolate reductase